ncbi:MAG: hypothetical protein GY742_06400 [Hyphomicrobiales bacterium]|nr:hypothetical protein [Hyphomicrobiales bacterium]
MSNMKKTLLAGLTAISLYMPNALAAQPVELLSGKFLMCDTASQVAEYLTMTGAEGKSGVEAREASGRNLEGHKVCGVGHWVYEMVGEHSKFEVGNSKYAINEIIVVGYVVNGIGQQSQPVKQFGFGLISKKAKPAGFDI